ncbi:Omega-hydroxypalmitate O-feruloyl [Musa troglodytarum]|uniref:Omega-hydroxypalmitate O-feruloyl n=1 Tax=Musa troglodytarum TaxID=320322 RepID=A0A9E7KPI7_9LILI|nr:Omega-hydroxypalmitate O-feruloyl [Musa troglodytarum]
MTSRPMQIATPLTGEDVEKGEASVLVSPRNPTPMKTIYLSNIDQTAAFPVETIFFYEMPPDDAAAVTSDVVERVKSSVSDVLLIPYYFMAGRLNFNLETKRLELLCNNAGALFVGATSRRSLEELGNLSAPNPSFQHLVTVFRCGGFSIGIMTNHSVVDGKSAAEMFENLAAICRGDGLKIRELHVDRSCIGARDPPQIRFHHAEYTKRRNHDYRVLSLSPDMIDGLKRKAMTECCSTFEAVVAHLWRARTKAVFDDPLEISSVLFAVDVRSKVSPPLPRGFTGNAVITASASAGAAELGERPLCFAVKRVREAIGRVTDEYVRSAVDWLEVNKGVPSVLERNFFVSAWWKLPFHELDFGWGKPVYGGPVVSGMHEFVLLLADGRKDGKRSGINVWAALEEEEMKSFARNVFEL